MQAIINVIDLDTIVIKQNNKSIKTVFEEILQKIKNLQAAIAALEGADALTNLNPRKRPRTLLKL